MKKTQKTKRNTALFLVANILVVTLTVLLSPTENVEAFSLPFIAKNKEEAVFDMKAIKENSLWVKTGSSEKREESTILYKEGMRVSVELPNDKESLLELIKQEELVNDDRSSYVLNSIDLKLEEIKAKEKRDGRIEEENNAVIEKKRLVQEEIDRKKAEVEAAKLAAIQEEQRIAREEILSQQRQTNGVEVCDPGANFYSWEPQLHNHPTRPNWSRGSLQANINAQAVTDSQGFSTYNGKYLVAMGTQYGQVGTSYEIEFTSGQVIQVILGDSKGDRCAHVNGSNRSMLEFIVDTHTEAAMPSSVLSSGKIPYFQGNISRMTRID